MTGPLWAALGVIVAAVLTLAGVIVREGRQRIADHDETRIKLIEQMSKRLADLNERVAAQDKQIAELWNSRRADAVTIRRMGDHIDVLEHWIYDGKPPPPPPRPEGL